MAASDSIASRATVEELSFYVWEVRGLLGDTLTLDRLPTIFEAFNDGVVPYQCGEHLVQFYADKCDRCERDKELRVID